MILDTYHTREFIVSSNQSFGQRTTASDQMDSQSLEDTHTYTQRVLQFESQHDGRNHIYDAEQKNREGSNKLDNETMKDKKVVQN